MDRMRSLTRPSAWLPTVLAAVLFLLLSAAFGSGLVAGPLWNGRRWVDSPAVTWLLLVAIVAAGIARTRRADGAGAATTDASGGPTPGRTADGIVAAAGGGAVWGLIALPIRLFVGRVWLGAGLNKLTDPAWMGSGQALHGFWQGAAAVDAAGQGRISYDWYRQFLLYMDGHQWYGWFAKGIVAGEVLVGVALLVGGFVGAAALGGALLNLNYGLAGVAGPNPILLLLALVLAALWRTAGAWGLDRWLLASRDAGERSAAGTRAGRQPRRVPASPQVPRPGSAPPRRGQARAIAPMRSRTSSLPATAR